MEVAWQTSCKNCLISNFRFQIYNSPIKLNKNGSLAAILYYGTVFRSNSKPEI
jgi:hypothetical protein